jgi:hypothetical protein
MSVDKYLFTMRFFPYHSPGYSLLSFLQARFMQLPSAELTCG